MSKFTFITNRNNGVTAVIRADDAKKYGEIMATGGDPLLAGVRIFSFTDKEHLDRNPEIKRIFTGDYEFLGELMDGHVPQYIANFPNSGWDGFVPYSNQEYGNPTYLTTTKDVVEKFGLGRIRD